MPTASDFPSIGAVIGAKLLDSRLALEYFRLEATMEDSPPVIGTGDFTSLMTKLVGLVKIGYSFKFYPARCHIQGQPLGVWDNGIITRKNPNGTYDVFNERAGMEFKNVKPWDIVEVRDHHEQP